LVAYITLPPIKNFSNPRIEQFKESASILKRTAFPEIDGNTSTSYDNSKSKGLRQEAVATYQKKFDDKSKKLDLQFTYNNNNSSFIQNNLNTNTVSLDNNSDFNLYNFRGFFFQIRNIHNNYSFSGIHYSF
jgi:beta-xylosidase